MKNQHQLAAILFTDIIGYTAMMQQDEQVAISVNKRYVTVLNELVPLHGGEILNDYGDGSLCTFTSATAAVKCALEMQQQLQKEPKVPLRIGLHIGEILFEDGKVFGDGVNIASRIQSLGQANAILFSKEFADKLRNQAGFKSVSLGFFSFKNVEEPMEVFALANEGLLIPRREQMEGKLREKKSSGRKLTIGIAILVLLAATFLLYNQFFRHSGISKTEKSIAILPFKIIGKGMDALGDGLVEDILVRLSKIKEIQVISNKSSGRYRDTKKSLKEIGEELGVNSLVMGTIQQDENSIRVSAQLIDCKTENTIWADTYDREIIKVFDLQAEVALQIVSALKTTLTPEEKKNLSKRYTENVEAYKLYRKGRSFWDKRNADSYDSAETYYKKAIELDPDYALAYVGLADCYTYNLKGLSQQEAIPIARVYVNKALALDSTLSEALTTYGFILGVFDFDFLGGLPYVKKAISLDPNYPLAHQYYANFLVQLSTNPDRGLEENEMAIQLDPLSVQFNYAYGRNLYFRHRLEAAREQLKKTLVLEPKYNLAKATLSQVLLAEKNYADAFEVIRQIPTTGPSTLQEYQGSLLSYAYAVSGNKVMAKIELEKTLKEYPNQQSYLLAKVYTILNDRDEALTRLEQAYKIREINLVYLKVDPELDPLRNEPRFKALMEKMGFNATTPD